MSEETPETSPETDAGTTSDAPAADATSSGTVRDGLGDDGGAALDRTQEAIDEARDAEGTVAAHDDITTHDAALAGEYSEDPGGEGGHP